MQPQFDSTTKAGTATGTLFTVLAQIHSDDLLRTAVLASLGAVVSFTVTLLLKALRRWWQRQ